MKSRTRASGRRARPKAPERAGSRGQSLVEFSLVFPVFMILLFGVLEFAFTMNAYLSIDFASRNAPLTAAEAGSTDSADCSILRTIEDSVTSPANSERIGQVRVFKADTNGNALGPANVYDRSGSMSCPLSDGTPATLPYREIANGYPSSSRCDELAGCNAQTSVDTIGIEISYTYSWVTPLHSLLPSSGPGYTIVESNAMRMEPVL